MAEELILPRTDNREEIYTALIPQIEAVLGGESDPVANMANAAAILREAFGFFWVDFYLVKGDELVLGPFQGPLACTRIRRGKGVCGTAWEQGRSQLVPDVELFPGHIACSSASRSEVVVPLWNEQGEVAGVLDVDSDRPDDFTAVDVRYLEAIGNIISRAIF